MEACIPFASFNELARRLEEAQRRIKELEDFFGAHDEEEARLKNELFEAQQRIVAQQAVWIDVLYEVENSNLANSVARKLFQNDTSDLSALTAHDAELTAKAKAEALEEARAGIDTIDDGEQPAYRHCQEFLGEKAAEYRAKAGRKE